MARDGNGTYSVVFTAVAGTTIQASDYNSQNADIATALTASIAKDGQTTPTANLPMGNYRHTGVGDATALTHYSSAKQVQNGSLMWGGTAGGTATALTITCSPAPTAYAAGQRFVFTTASSQNGTSTTINVNSLGAKTISNPIWSSGDVVEVLYDGTNFFAQSPTTSDTVVIPSGTTMLFYATSAPTGWTQSTSINDYMVRVVSGSGTGVGGTWTLSGLSTETVAHTHTYNGTTSVKNGGTSQGTSASGGASTPLDNHTHTFSGTTSVEAANHSHIGDGLWRPAYVDFIICVKD